MVRNLLQRHQEEKVTHVGFINLLLNQAMRSNQEIMITNIGISQDSKPISNCD